MAEETNKIGGVKTVEVAAPKTATGTDAEGKKTGYRKMEVVFNFGESLDEAIELYTEEVIFAAFVASVTIDLQNFVRTKLEATSEDGSYTNSVEAIEAEVANWKPGVKSRERVSPMDKIKKLLGNLTEEQRVALFASHGIEVPN